MTGKNEMQEKHLRTTSAWAEEERKLRAALADQQQLLGGAERRIGEVGRFDELSKAQAAHLNKKCVELAVDSFQRRQDLHDNAHSTLHEKSLHEKSMHLHFFDM